MNSTVTEILNKDTYGFNDLVSIMELLRSENGCPWDREQTHSSIRKNFIEETYEVVEAIDKDDKKLLREELGDVMLQVVFHARIEEEAGVFNISEVCDDICKKLIIRHPHIFADTVAKDSDAVLSNWEEIKKQTKGMTKQSQSLMDVPVVLPSLMRATKLQQRAAKVGFDWDDINDVIAKVEEETAELKSAIASESPERQAEELGDLLFSVTNLSRFIKCDAEEALYGANEKFIRRFRIIERLAEESGRNLKDMTLSEMDVLWEQAKTM